MNQQNIFLLGDIFKITKITKQYIYINNLQPDGKLIYKADDFKFNDVLKLCDNILYHYEDKIDDKKQFKIKKSQFNNYIIIDNIDDAYIYNKELYYNYKNSLWFQNNWRFQGQLLIKYYIELLTNDEIKNNNGKERDEELYDLIFSIVQENDIESIKEMGLYSIYQSLKDEAYNKHFKDKIKVNTECPVCLSSDNNVYQKFYSCCHAVCHQCYIKWIPKNTNIRNCPICRAQ